MADQPGGLHSYPQPGSASRTGRSARDRNMGRYPLPMWKARYAGPGALPQCLNRRAGALLGNIRAHGSLWPPRLALSSILQSMNGFIIRACGRFVKDFPAYGGQPRLVILNAKEQTPRRTTGASSIAFIFLYHKNRKMQEKRG